MAKNFDPEDIRLIGSLYGINIYGNFDEPIQLDPGYTLVECIERWCDANNASARVGANGIYIMVRHD